MEHAHHDTHGAAQGSLKSYLVGFVLSILLTVVPFALVMNGSLGKGAILVGISLAALVQILVQLYFFLHLDSSPKQRWNLLTFIFTVIILVFLVGGSLWIMYHLNARTMTMTTDHGHIANMHH